MLNTIPELFQSSVRQYGTNTMMWEKEDKEYRAFSYNEINTRVINVAAALHSMGIKKGDRIVMLGEGCNDWIVSELAILHLGAVNVPLSIKIIESLELKFRIIHSEARLVFVSYTQLPKIRDLKKELTLIEKIIVFGAHPCELDKDEKSLTDFEASGLDYFSNENIDFNTIWQSVEGTDCATISYTSGTTAEPKGIMLSHRNYTANVEQSEGLFTIPSWYRTLLILPWDHSFAHTVGLYPLIKNGGSIACVQVGKTAAETLKNIPVNIKEIKPTFILSVPALSKNFRKNIESNIAQKGKFISSLFKAGLKTAYKYHRNGFDRGREFSFLLWPVVKLFDILIFNKIRQAFGGRLLFFVGGGALLDIELQKFFCAIGIPVYQGYGLTEASPVISSNNPKHHKFGSSGKLVPNLTCTIMDEDRNPLPVGTKGEIAIEGENVMMGYWRNEKATTECLSNGKLYTGDLGWLDKDGFLYVTGRFKSLLISHDGEKYSPEGIEEAMAAKCALIEQIMLYNDHKPYTVALVYPGIDAIKQICLENKVDYNSEEGRIFVLKSIKADVGKFFNGGEYSGLFPERWLPSAFAILEEGFTEQNRLMNSTMKIVRPKIMEKYRAKLDYLYTPEGKDIENTPNIQVLASLIS